MSAADQEQANWAATQLGSNRISSKALLAFLASCGIRPALMQVMHDDYSLPDPKWVAGEFGSSWSAVLNGLGYKADETSTDCVEFAAGARWWAQFLQQRTRPDDSALALGEFHYFPESGGGHAVCCAVWRGGPWLKLGFFEPQPSESHGGFVTGTMQPLQLSPCERSTCSFCRF